MRFLVLLIGLVLAFPAQAADVAAASQKIGLCQRYTLCSAESTTSTACQDSGNTNEIVAQVNGSSANLVAYTTKSSATTYTIDIYTSDSGFDGTIRKKVNGASLTATNPSVPLSGSLMDVWAVTGATITGGTITTELYVCP